MGKYICKRLLISILTISIILFVLFLMLTFMPGSPFNDEKLSKDQIALLYAKYGLNRPFYIRFFHYIKNMFQGDFGVSYTIQPNMPISSMLKGRLEISVALGLQAMIAGTLVGLILGIFAAIKHNTVFDTGATVISALGISLPSYVFAIVLSYFIGYKARLFPMLYSSKAAISSIVLPTVALAMFPIATISRYTRSEMLDVLGSDYMLFAETKGINRWRIMILHGLRNAFIPILTVLGPMVVGLMMGSMVVENIFSIPGIGSLLVLAIQDNDYNVVLAITFICSDLYIVVNLFVDMLYCMIDPRIRLTKGSERNE